MPSGGYQDVVNKLEALKAQFVARVVVELDDNVAKLHAVEGNAAGIRTLKQGYEWLHRLAGSAGTFGFQALGSQARKLEETLKQVVEMDSDDLSGLLATVLDEDFYQRLDSLPDLLKADAGDCAIPLLQRAVAEPEDGALQRVDLISANDEVRRELEQGLSRYGYRVAVFDSPDGYRRDHASTGENLAALVADADLLDAVHGVVAELERHSDLPLVFVAHEESFDVRYRVADAGAGGFFTVPVDIPALADRIQQLNEEREERQGGKVLIVDDDDQLVEHYRLVLEAGGLEVVTVTHPPDVIRRLSEYRPDIVLMDIHMGDYSGINLARMIRFQPEWLGLPIIYLSSEQDRDEQISAIAEGADDFIEKPIRDHRLVKEVKARCVRARQLSKLASLDSLTGLLKHSLVKQELAKEFDRCRRYGLAAQVAMLDLDHFKRVNDSHGHAVGDVVIRALANLLRHRLRKTDIIGRYGGEEFVVILPDCSAEVAEEILQDVCGQFAGLVFAGDGEEFQVTLSAGVASLRNFASAEAALNAADEAMYQRKRAGRNGVTLYRPRDPNHRDDQEARA